MGFGEDDDNIEDGEDVVDTDEETRDEIDDAATPFMSPQKQAAPSTVVGRSREQSTAILADIYSSTGGLMPSFPAGRMPFIVASLVACATGLAAVMIALWSYQVPRFPLRRCRPALRVASECPPTPHPTDSSMLNNAASPWCLSIKSGVHQVRRI